MLELEEAVATILGEIPPAKSESINLDRAHRRVLAERVVSPADLPIFDNSAMDGYAVRAKDVEGAKTEVPVRLRVRGRAAAGSVFEGGVEPGACVRVFTGSPLPRGADAVVMQEDTRPDPAGPDAVLVLDGVRPGENVRPGGEDVKRGATLAEPGDFLSAGGMSLLAAAGVTRLNVGRQPVVGLLATGSELREGGGPLLPGQIHESNRVGLAVLAKGVGALPRILPLVPDTLEATRSALETAFAGCDVVVTTGGVSVGEMDFVKTAFEPLGGRLQFWKVAIKPGRPFAFGRLGEKFLFGLPGNPVSALVTFLLLVRPALARWQGATDVTLPVNTGWLAEPLRNPGERRHFMRVAVDAAGKVRSAGVQASHILSAMAAAKGLVDVPPKTTLDMGATVQVIRWE